MDDAVKYEADLSALSPDERDKAQDILEWNALSGTDWYVGKPLIRFVMKPSTLKSLSSLLPKGIRFTILNM